IRPDDADELRRGFERLSPESRYRRFLSGVHQLSDEALRYLTHVDERDHLAIVVTRPRPDGSEEGLGVARFIRLRDEPTADEPAARRSHALLRAASTWLDGLVHFRLR